MRHHDQPCDHAVHYSSIACISICYGSFSAWLVCMLFASSDWMSRAVCRAFACGMPNRHARARGLAAALCNLWFFGPGARADKGIFHKNCACFSWLLRGLHPTSYCASVI